MHFQPIEPSGEDAYLTAVAMPPAVDEAGADALDDPLGDVFGSEPPSPPAEHHALHRALHGGAHPSDMHRLQTEHTTAGYREGITVAKASSVQAGFDEGFALGATIGLQVGLLLGMLEGISDAVRAEAGAPAAEKQLADAREELSMAHIFSPEFWAPDGNWTYEVVAPDGDEVVFAHVASAHPLVSKWSRIVDEQVEAWGIDRRILDDETGPRLVFVAEEPLNSAATPAPASRPLDW